MANYVYGYNNYTHIVGGFTLVGLGSVRISYDNNITETTQIADGDTITSLIKGTIASIIFSVHQKSPNNDFFSKLYREYQAGIIRPMPYITRESGGVDLHIASHINLVKFPDISLEAESSMIDWEFKAPTLESYVGSGVSL